MTTLVLSDQQTHALLRQALARLDANDLVQAETLLLQILEGRPKEPDALQLMGLIRRAQNRPAEAEDFYRRSLAERPAQPHVHHNLGNLLLSLNRNEEALAALQEALRQKPNYVEALLNAGKAHAALGQNEAAEKAFSRALWLNPGNPLALQLLGGTLNDLGKPKEAEIVLRKALAAQPNNPRQAAAFEHNLAVSLSLQRRYGEAIELFDAAQAKVPDMPLADFNRAEALQHLGRLDEAVESYRRAIARMPLDLASHKQLNDLLYRLGREDEFLKSYDEVASLYPDIGELPLEKARFQFQREDYEAARENFERAMYMLPANVTPHDGIALILARTGDLEGAIREHEIVLRMEPANAHGWRNYAETLLRAGDAKKAEEAAQEALKIEPQHQAALAIWGTALALLDDPRGDALNDYERFVVPYELKAPEGYSDMESFNRDLNRYLDALHGGKREFLEQTLRGGTQTLDNLFGKGHDLVERLRARIDEAVADYIARMKDDANHPLMKRRRREFEYAASWSARLHDCGFHTNHTHPKGWISSAYYVAVPDSVADEKSRQGWIKFGEPNFDAGPKAAVRRAVKPVPGALVLFPSYMWHGTIPFRSAESRTTIAFDVVPL
ncbi:MAG TPA: tetratricopeptide repeat protein [Rhizomicrobium sp.]|nr:tetratricopeptide repeat protein [Rhizomicrobium sp.]